MLVVAEEEAGAGAPPGAGERPEAGEEDVFAGVPDRVRDAVRGAAWPRRLGCVPASGVCVYVDPLDGTGEFSRANYGVVTNLIGIAVDGRPVAGVINQPFCGHVPGAGLASARARTVWGGPGAGVHGLGAADAPPAGALTACANRVKDDRILPSLEAMGVAPRDVSWISASGFNMLEVISGRRTLYVVTRKGTKKWDTCGATALVEARGGRVTDVLGRE